MPQNVRDILKKGLNDFDELPSPSSDSRYWNDEGRIIARPIAVKVGMSNNPKTTVKRYCVIDFEVLEVSEGPYRKGQIYTYWRNLEAPFHQKDLRSMLAALADAPANRVDSNMMINALAASVDGPGGDAIIGLQCEVVLTTGKKKTINQKTGKPFVNPKFYAVTNVDF